ncbi:hypothetical protein GCM10007386_44700 [Pseudoduganella dura]|nr:hypothetical protein GCM10007386_44700 [Pseudoduganella dura]
MSGEYGAGTGAGRGNDRGAMRMTAVMAAAGRMKRKPQRKAKRKTNPPSFRGEPVAERRPGRPWVGGILVILGSGRPAWMAASCPIIHTPARRAGHDAPAGVANVPYHHVFCR